MLTVKFKRVRPTEDEDIPLPRFMTILAAGMDLCAAVEKPIALTPGEIRLIPTGFAVAIPPGYEAQIRPRSGLAVQHGIGLINSPGTIDADYRGEIRVALINMGQDTVPINRGDRIAQMLIKKLYPVKTVIVEELEETDRGSGGFGHTGV